MPIGIRVKLELGVQPDWSYKVLQIKNLLPKKFIYLYTKRGNYYEID